MTHQHFVGSVTITLGVLAVLASLRNSEWLFRLAKIQLLERLCGRPTARWICALAGCAIIAVGICILSGWLPRRAEIRTSGSWWSENICRRVLAC